MIFSDDFSYKPSFLLIAVSLLILVASYFSFIYPIANSIIAFLLLLFILLATFIKLEFGVLAILAELTLGGHGYLFSFSTPNFVVSFRIALFVIVGIGWMCYLYRKRKLPHILHSGVRFPLIIFIAFVVLGLCIGVARNDLSFVFYDANAYLAIGYIFYFSEVVRKPAHLQRLITVLISFSLGLAVATISLLGIYATAHYDDSLRGASSINTSTLQELAETQTSSQDAELGQRLAKTTESLSLNENHLTKTKPATYRWLRDSGIAEISYISGRFFRVFFPSHMFLLVTAFFILYGLWKKKYKHVALWGWLLLALAALYVSFSRSIWLGMCVGFLAFVSFTITYSSQKKRLVLLYIGLTICIAVVMLLTGVGAQFIDRIESILHPEAEVASLHRVELLKSILAELNNRPLFGSGFGTTVTFPTVLPNGEVTKTSFLIYEWSYLDLAVKTGLCGLFSFLILLFSVGRGLITRIKRLRQSPIFCALFSSLIALSVTNMTTPVFTHPLGLGALAVIISLSATYNNESTNSNSHLE